MPSSLRTLPPSILLLLARSAARTAEDAEDAEARALARDRVRQLAAELERRGAPLLIGPCD